MAYLLCVNKWRT